MIKHRLIDNIFRSDLRQSRWTRAALRKKNRQYLLSLCQEWARRKALHRLKFTPRIKAKKNNIHVSADQLKKISVTPDFVNFCLNACNACYDRHLYRYACSALTAAPGCLPRHDNVTLYRVACICGGDRYTCDQHYYQTRDCQICICAAKNARIVAAECARLAAAAAAEAAHISHRGLYCLCKRTIGTLPTADRHVMLERSCTNVRTYTRPLLLKLVSKHATIELWLNESMKRFTPPCTFEIGQNTVIFNRPHKCGHRMIVPTNYRSQVYMLNYNRTVLLLGW